MGQESLSAIRVYTKNDSLVVPYPVSRILIFGIMVVTEEIILIDYSDILFLCIKGIRFQLSP